MAAARAAIVDALAADIDELIDELLIAPEASAAAAKEDANRLAAIALACLREGRGLTAGDRAVIALIGSRRAEADASLDSVVGALRLARTAAWSRIVAMALRVDAPGLAIAAALGELAHRVVHLSEDVTVALATGHERVQEQRGQARGRTLSRLLDDLLGGPVDEAEVTLEARRFSIDLGQPLGILLLATSRPDPSHAAVRAAAADLRRARGRADVQALMLRDVAPHVAVLVPGGLAEWAEATEAAESVCRQHRITAVVTPPVVGARAVHDAYARSRELLTIALTVFRRPRVIEVDELLMYEVLRGSAEAPRTQFVERTVGALLHLGDAASRDAALATLDALYEAAGHTETAAAFLGVHTNTVRYRVGRIAQLTGYSYDRPPDRFRLDMAMILLRMSSPPARR